MREGLRGPLRPEKLGDSAELRVHPTFSYSHLPTFNRRPDHDFLALQLGWFSAAASRPAFLFNMRALMRAITVAVGRTSA